MRTSGGHHLLSIGCEGGAGDGGGSVACECRRGTASVSQVQTREVVAEVAVLSAKFEAAPPPSRSCK